MIKKRKQKSKQLSHAKKIKVNKKKTSKKVIRKKAIKTKRQSIKLPRKMKGLGNKKLLPAKASPVTKLSSKNDGEVFLFSEDNVAVYKQKVEITREVTVENLSDNKKINQINDKLDAFATPETNKVTAINKGSQFINIKKNSNPQSSPHVVNLKNQDFYSQRVLSNIPSKISWEEKISHWDQKIQRVKTNFITPEIKQYKYQESFSVNTQPNFLKRLWLRTGGGMGSIYQYLIDSFSRWGENKTEAFLQRAAQKSDMTVDKDYLLTETKNEEKHLSIFPADILVSLKLFVIMALVLIVPLQGYTYYHDLKSQRAMVLGATSSIYDDFQQGFVAFEKLDFSAAGDRFVDAQADLFSVNQILEKYPSFLISLSRVIPSIGQEVSSGLNIMAAGNKMADLGIRLSNLFNDLQTNKADNIAILHSLQQGLNEAGVTLQEIEDLLAKVDSNNIPSDYREQFDQLSSLLPSAKKVFQNAAEVSLFASDWLGANEPQRYLLVFQNSNELRPSGGFIGSIAEVDIKNGKLQNFYLPPGGVYDLQGNLEILLASPEPLRLLNANWQLQDSNWFFDFPTSAKKIMWFYEKSGGPTVDGVIAVNSQILPKLLTITGPIELKDFNLVLNADNVISELQTEVEVNYDRELNQPKKIIASLMPIILQRLENLPPQDFFSMFSLLHNALQVRDIQLYHQQANLQEKIKYFGFGGEVQNTDYDYLAMVDTNIGGGKTDQVISSQVLLTSSININGEVINSLKIIKQHNGVPMDVFTGQMYRDYLRVYVPKGSKLVAATGFTPPNADEFNHPAAGFSEDEFLKNVETNEWIDLGTGTRITDEFGKTVFGNWIALLPGEQKEVSITYVLPNKVEFKKQNQDNYFINLVDKFLANIGLSNAGDNEVAMHTLLLQKQSGQPPYSFSHEIIFPNTWEILVSNLLKNNTARRDNRVYYQNTINSDQVWGVIFNR